MAISRLRVGLHSCLRRPTRASLLLLLALGAQTGCHAAIAPGAGTPLLDLTTSSLQAGSFPQKFTCDGRDTSPELKWTSAPPATKSFALIAIDLDAPMGQFVHWVLYNIPAAARELPEGLPTQEQLPDGSLQGRNDFDRIGYGGPCPPGSSPHRYVFRLYALDANLSLPAGATRAQIEKAIAGHILAHGELTGRYQR